MATTKTAPVATVAKKTAPVAAPAAAPAAPTYLLRSYDPATKQGWPVKAQTGNSIRAYCYTVAKKLAEQHKGGFTTAQFAAALAANAAGSTYKQPSTGWVAGSGRRVLGAGWGWACRSAASRAPQRSTSQGMAWARTSPMCATTGTSISYASATAPMASATCKATRPRAGVAQERA